MYSLGRTFLTSIEVIELLTNLLCPNFSSSVSVSIIFLPSTSENSNPSCKGTIQPGLRLVPSGNFFLALNRSHHFSVKKSRNLIRQLEHNDSNLITLLYILSIFSNVKLSKLNHSAKVAYS